jgi:hypothetical protein
MKNKKSRQLVWALKVCFVLFLVKGVIVVGVDMVRGFKAGWNESSINDNVYPSEALLSIKEIKKETIAENDRYKITGISQVIVQKKKSPKYSFQKFLISCLQFSFVIISCAYTIRVLKYGYKFIKQFDLDKGLDMDAVSNLNKTGISTLVVSGAVFLFSVAEALNQYFFMQFPGYAFEYDIEWPFETILFGLILLITAAVIKYNLELKAEQDLII